MTVNNWLKCFESEGIKSLKRKSGRGRKTILQAVDLEQLKEAVKQSRQRISLARSELENSLSKEFSDSSLKRFLKKNACRDTRIRKRLKDMPNEQAYRLKKEVLGDLESLSEAGLIELFYGDESGVNLEPNVPYGWQFADEEVSMPTARGKGINCFGLFTRNNQAVVATSESAINSEFVIEQLERLSFSIRKPTVVV